MTHEDREMLETGYHHIGPVLRSALPLLKDMPRVPVCAACPAAQWYKFGDNLLECHCTEFRSVMYERGSKVVIDCDSRRYLISGEPPHPDPDVTRPAVLDAPAAQRKVAEQSLCESCPASRWYRFADDSLGSYCTQYRGRMFGAGRDEVKACDAREDEIARIGSDD